MPEVYFPRRPGLGIDSVLALDAGLVGACGWSRITHAPLGALA